MDTSKQIGEFAKKMETLANVLGQQVHDSDVDPDKFACTVNGRSYSFSCEDQWTRSFGTINPLRREFSGEYGDYTRRVDSDLNESWTLDLDELFDFLEDFEEISKNINEVLLVTSGKLEEATKRADALLAEHVTSSDETED